LDQKDEFVVKNLDEMKLTFGDVLGERLFLLEPTIIRLQHGWQVYRSLFGANEQRWDFLHKAGGSAMVSIESALWDKILLSLCRLTDLDSSRGSKRVTLHQLSPKDCSYKDPECGRAIKKAVKEAVNAIKPIRKIRDQRIAHLNLDVALGETFIDKVTRAQIEAAVLAIAKPIKLIYAIERDTEILDRPPIGSSDSAVTLLNSPYLGDTIDRKTIERSTYPEWLMFGEWDR
jgi:hypothetical protein